MLLKDMPKELPSGLREIQELASIAPVTEWQVSGVDVWPVLRTAVLQRAVRAKLLQESAVSRWQNRVREQTRCAALHTVGDFALQRLLNVGTRNRSVESGAVAPADALLVGNSGAAFRLGRNIVQPHLDPMRIALAAEGGRSTTWICNVSRRAPVIEDALLPGTYGVGDALSASRAIHHPRLAALTGLLPHFAQWLAEIRALGFCGALYEPLLRAEVAAVLSVSASLRSLLQRIGPKIVAMYNADCTLGYAVAYAARSLRIPFVEVQHGVQGPAHHSYQWPEIPPAGFNCLPSAYLCWSDREQQAILDWGERAGVKAFVAGHSWRHIGPALEAAAQGPFADATADARTAYQASAGQVDVITAGKRNVLLTTAPSEIPPWVGQLVEQLPESWQLLWRLHPRDALNSGALARAQAEVDGRANVADATLAPLDILLDAVDVHLTQASAVTLEAAAYGVPTVVTSPLGLELFADEVPVSVTLAESTADIIAALGDSMRALRTGCGSEDAFQQLAASLQALGCVGEEV